MPLKCQIPVFVVIITSFAMLPLLPGCQAGGCGCPPLWTAFQNHCYRYFSVKNITWLGAEMHCRSFSVPCTDADSDVSLGHLTSIHSREEMDFLSVLYEGLRSKVVINLTKVWIGLHDRATEDSWEWSDGSLFDFNQWESGQPNDWNGQDCVEFHLTDVGYEWGDLLCDISAENAHAPTGYVCKLPKW